MQLPANAHIDHAAELAQLLPAEVAGGSGVLQIDASELKSLDSSTIALLMQAERLARAAGRTVQITGAPPKLVQLAQLYGVSELLALA